MRSWVDNTIIVITTNPLGLMRINGARLDVNPVSNYFMVSLKDGRDTWFYKEIAVIESFETLVLHSMYSVAGRAGMRGTYCGLVCQL